MTSGGVRTRGRQLPVRVIEPFVRLTSRWRDPRHFSRRLAV